MFIYLEFNHAKRPIILYYKVTVFLGQDNTKYEYRQLGYNNR
jgi:hypothetical protein